MVLLRDLLNFTALFHVEQCPNHVKCMCSPCRYYVVLRWRFYVIRTRSKALRNYFRHCHSSERLDP